MDRTGGEGEDSQTFFRHCFGGLLDLGATLIIKHDFVALRAEVGVAASDHSLERAFDVCCIALAALDCHTHPLPLTRERYLVLPLANAIPNIRLAESVQKVEERNEEWDNDPKWNDDGPGSGDGVTDETPDS